jgi:hypothetical protein
MHTVKWIMWETVTYSHGSRTRSSAKRYNLAPDLFLSCRVRFPQNGDGFKYLVIWVHIFAGSMFNPIVRFIRIIAYGLRLLTVCVKFLLGLHLLVVSASSAKPETHAIFHHNIEVNSNYIWLYIWKTPCIQAFRHRFDCHPYKWFLLTSFSLGYVLIINVKHQVHNLDHPLLLTPLPSVCYSIPTLLVVVVSSLLQT